MVLPAAGIRLAAETQINDAETPFKAALIRIYFFSNASNANSAGRYRIEARSKCRALATDL